MHETRSNTRFTCEIFNKTNNALRGSFLLKEGKAISENRNYPMTDDEIKRRPSLSDKHKVKFVKWRTGRTHSDRTKAKMSKGRKGVPQNPEFAARRIAATRGLTRTPEQRANIAAGQIGLKRSPQSVAKSVAGHRATRPAKLQGAARAVDAAVRAIAVVAVGRGEGVGP
jgi:hypothetical protein